METVELFLGKRVHETLEKLYVDLCSQKQNTLRELLDFLHNIWTENWNDSIKIVKPEFNPNDYLSMAKNYVKGYYQQYTPFDNERTIAIEKRIVANLNNSSRCKLICYIDRVAKTSDYVYQIHEYKTSSHLPSLDNMKSNWQIPLYAIMLKMKYSYIKKVKLIWHFLKFKKELSVTPATIDVKKIENDVTLLINKIEHISYFRPHPSKLCAWCEFNKICRS